MRKSQALTASLALAMAQQQQRGVRVETVTSQLLPAYGLADAMLELARRPPPPRTRPQPQTVDGAKHCMLAIFAGQMSGGLTRYAFPPPQFELVCGAYVDRTYSPPEIGSSSITYSNGDAHA